MPLNEATKRNLQRKSHYVDHVQMHEDVPLFSWVDLNLTELCNRACVFCPRADPNYYPNQKLHMPIKLAQKMADELRELKYEGVVVLCGFGEPLLHPQLIDLVKCFNSTVRVEVVTNGDRLNSKRIRELIDAGIDYFVVSLYDGPHQIEPMRKRFFDAGADDYFLLRDRWHTEEDSFGLKLTNRAGVVKVGRQDPVDITHPCHYLTYQMTVDWNGDVLLCVQDWNKKVKYGNLQAQSMWEIWTSPAMHKRRMKLIDGERTDSPCNKCNADGTLHGFNHVPVWLNDER